VALLCDLPAAGRDGRPSKAFTLAQAAAVLDAAEGTAMYAYVVLSILIGARTEELRALTWDHVDLDGDPEADPRGAVDHGAAVGPGRWQDQDP
jgi:integrase